LRCRQGFTFLLIIVPFLFWKISVSVIESSKGGQVLLFGIYLEFGAWNLEFIIERLAL